MLQLVLDQNGNYVYQDVAQKKTTPVDTTSFEAYEQKQKTTLAGETDIGSQTQQLMREAPGEYVTTFNQETGQFETKQKDQTTPVTVDVKPIDQTEVAPQETALQKVSRITESTRPEPLDIKGIAQDTMQMFKPTFKEKAIDTALQVGSDIAVNYVTKKLLGQTFAGSLASSSIGTSPIMGVNPALAVGGALLASGAGEKVVKGASKVVKGVAKAGKSIIKAFTGGTVICTELYRQNLMSREDHKLSWNFTINNFSETHINGYWYWAVPMVKLMKKNKLVTKFWNHVMSNRTKDIKWRLNKGKFNLLGRLYSILIENGSYVIGKIIKDKKIKEVLV